MPLLDIKTPEQRSENMSRIKSTNTKPELQVRQYLQTNNIRYRCNVRDLPGKPDIAIKKYKTAIIINGCFWHAHEGCKDFRLPKSNTGFWETKIAGNVKRDKKNKQKLQNLNFKTFTIWECEIKKHDFSTINQAIQHINKQN